MGVAEPTFYRWKKVYAGMGVTEIRRLKQLEDENGNGREFAGRMLDQCACLNGIEIAFPRPG